MDTMRYTDPQVADRQPQLDGFGTMKPSKRSKQWIWITAVSSLGVLLIVALGFLFFSRQTTGDQNGQIDEITRVSTDRQAQIADLEEQVTDLEEQVSVLQQGLEEAESEANAARAEAAALRGELSNVRRALERAKRNYASATACIDDLVFAYNSASSVFEIPRNFGAALNGANCSALGYYFEE